MLMWVLTAGALFAQTPQPAAQPPAATGRIGGRVVDAATSKPLTSVRVVVLGQVGVVETDLDGRFRTGPVAAGIRSIRVALIGYRPVQLDTIRVKDGQTTVVTVALAQAPVELQELTVASDAPAKTSNAAGLLVLQQSAASVTDGVSSETISKTPDKDAGAAIARVTGLSVVSNKVVVRGLSERYSSSLLNGVEIASPEPDKKFVPLDAFNANLLESIVAYKTATPDRPGDFAGGTVDIQTKEFPENFVFRFGYSQGYNSRSTFKSFPRGPRTFKDRLGFDGRGRGIRPNNDAEKFAEGLSTIWTPGVQKADPNGALDFSVGGRKDLGNDVFGYVASFTYANERAFNPDRLNGEGGAGTPIIFQEATERVDWSGIANLAYRLGSGQKFGFKNFYARGTEELYRKGAGGDNGDGPSLNFQGDFLEKYVEQSQLTGDHYLNGLLKSRFNWKLSYGQAGRADLDNRQLRYFDQGAGFIVGTAVPSYRYNNSLLDKSYTGQVDWAFPFSLTHDQGGEFKIGSAYRRKDRDFQAQSYELAIAPAGRPLTSLPPEELLAPENLAANLISYQGTGAALTPYSAREEVKALYGMVDMDLVRGLRLVGGLRAERWNASVVDGVQPRDYEKTSLLWSANLTWIVSNHTNLRFAAYKTVARPDLRELAQGGYSEVVGGVPVIGNAALVPARITNGDVRFEIYPGAGELLAVSGFYKRFEQPIVTTFVNAGGIFARPDNLDHATSLGLEFEARKSLVFVSKGLKNFSVGANLTLIRSRVRYPAAFLLATDPNLRFQGQSPYLINANLGYGSDDSRFSVSVLFNRYGDRILRYGVAADPRSGVIPSNMIERPRSALDAKVKLGLWRGVSVSLSGKNLLDQPVESTFDNLRPDQTGFLGGRSRSGRSFSMGLSYAH